MSYYESAAETTITKTRALIELHNHGIFHELDLNEFYKDCGDKTHYDAQEVLRWLGY